MDRESSIVANGRPFDSHRIIYLEPRNARPAGSNSSTDPRSPRSVIIIQSGSIDMNDVRENG